MVKGVRGKEYIRTQRYRLHLIHAIADLMIKNNIPPEEFVEAVLSSASNDSLEAISRFLRLTHPNND